MDPKRTALVLIEYQNEFCSPGGVLHDAVKPAMDVTNMLANSAKLLEAARERGVKILHCPISFADGYPELSAAPYGILANVKAGGAFKAGSWGAAICNAISVQATDVVVQGKRGLCGFHSTNLDFILRHNDIKHVVIGGFLTNCCVESTMRAAYEAGYDVITLSDCTAATSLEEQEMAFKYTFKMFSKPMASSDLLAALA